MKKAAFLSMDSLKDFECYDHLAVKPLNQLGWDVEEVSWRNKNVIWSDYDAVVVRSTWDYQTDHKKFLNVLVEINDSSAHLENDLSILKWNMNKKYLADLEEKGITIVESIWEKNYQPGNLAEYFDKLNCEEIIIKPNVSGNADNTFRLSKNILSSDRLHNCEDELLKIFNEREFMVQPFIVNIVTEGEYSLFYFNGEYSHSILKKPKENDFRVQEEHGGRLTAAEPDFHLKKISENILAAIDGDPLYARIDLIRTPADEFALMELELIEPSLYFNMDNESAKRFAYAFDQRMKSI